MNTGEVERHSLLVDTTETRSFDEIAKELAAGTTSRERVLKGLIGPLLGGGLLALVSGEARANAHQSSGGSAITGGGGRRRQKHQNGGDGRRLRTRPLAHRRKTLGLVNPAKSERTGTPPGPRGPRSRFHPDRSVDRRRSLLRRFRLRRSPLRRLHPLEFSALG
jgi:hypothetical protein